jgi:hypothetical protein
MSKRKQSQFSPAQQKQMRQNAQRELANQLNALEQQQVRGVLISDPETSTEALFHTLKSNGYEGKKECVGAYADSWKVGRKETAKLGPQAVAQWELEQIENDLLLDIQTATFETQVTANEVEKVRKLGGCKLVMERAVKNLQARNFDKVRESLLEVVGAIEEVRGYTMETLRNKVNFLFPVWVEAPAETEDSDSDGR